MICMCEDWKINIMKINDLLNIARIHSIKVDDIKEFKYCPYCGKELHEEPI